MTNLRLTFKSNGQFLGSLLLGPAFGRNVLAPCWMTVIAFVWTLAWDCTVASEQPQPQPSPAVEGTAPRVAWTTSRIIGSPDPPPPFRSTRVFPEIAFDRPLQITRCPDSDRLFFTEERGKIYSVSPTPGAKPELFCDLPKQLRLDKIEGVRGLGTLFALAFHPRFAENRFCYLCYTLNTTTEFDPNGTRISRFTVSKTDPPRLEPESEEIIITWQGGGHNGCDMHFGPRDGMLYFSTGDGRAPNPPDPVNTGQDCSDLLSSIVRIDVDCRDPGANYAIPPDNPFVGMDDVRPEIWAFGFRNPFRMSFDRENGDLWVGDVGWELWEMVHKVEKGGNYGWSIVEGRQSTKPDQPVGPTPILSPTIELPHTIACSVTGGYVYRGQRFPELSGAYLFGDWETRRIWAARFEDGRLKEMPEIVKPNIRVSAFGEDNAGEFYYVDYDTGFVYTLERNDLSESNATFPTKLSETGLFEDVVHMEPAAGVMPFSPAVKQWQDGARATHYFAFPGQSTVTVFDEPRPLPGQVHWHRFRLQFPTNAVLVKHLTLDTSGRPSQPIETQLLHYDGEDWRGYSYAWRDDGSDADLVPSTGAQKKLRVDDLRRPGSEREVEWTFHSRNQCTVCHNTWSEYALAFSVEQLNVKGSENNPLVELSQQGFITRVDRGDQPLPPFDIELAVREPALQSEHETDSKPGLDEQARAYLHVNCSHCHRFGGGGGQVVLEMKHSQPLMDMGIFNVPPRQGDFGITDARIVKPGDPLRSVLLYRMAKFGRGRMPHLGSEMPDGSGLEMISRWIESLGDSTDSPPQDIGDAVDPLAKVETALSLACRLANPDSSSSPEVLRELTPSLSALGSGPIRELFEGYLPPELQRQKLGDHPEPETILSLTGDARRGEVIYFANEMKCVTCHRFGDKGGMLGPELTTIGRQRRKPELLESLLEPSRQIDPKFAQYLVLDQEGRAWSGLLVSRSAEQIVLRTVDNKDIGIAIEDLEQLRPSAVSLMPDGLISELTPQEAADLLEFLVNPTPAVK